MLQFLAAAVLFSGTQAKLSARDVHTETATKTLFVIYVDCARNRGLLVSLRITARDLRLSRVVYTMETLASTGVVKNEVVHLRPGAYEIMASSGDCSQTSVVQLLNDPTPIVFMGALGARMFSARTSIAGSLPVDGAIVYSI